MSEGFAGTLSAEEQRAVELAIQFQNGNAEAFDKLYSLLYDKIYYFIFKMVRDQYTAEDICQEVFLTAYRNIPKMEKPQALKKWLNMTAYHSTIDFIRSARAKNGITEDIDEQEALPAEENTSNDACRYVLEKERRETIMKALETLRLPLRTTVMLKFYSDLKEREIAEVMNVPVGTVKSRLNAAKKELAGQLTGLYSIAPLFMLRLYFIRKSGETGLAAGLKLHSRTARRIAAVAAGVTTGAAAVALTQAPVISSLKLYEPERYVNEQTIEWSVNSVFPVKKTEIKGTPYQVKEENGVYRAVIPENGTYTVKVTDSSGKSSERSVEIKNIDSAGPRYCSYQENGEGMLLTFADDLSGIAWEELHFTDRTGGKVEPLGADRESGTVLISKNDFPLNAHMEDDAGNYADYEIDMNTVSLASEEKNAGTAAGGAQNE